MKLRPSLPQVAAKDARADRAAADAAVERAGVAIELDAAGRGEVTLPDGAVVPVRGRWDDGGGAPLLCLTDSSTAVHGAKADPAQFDGVLAALGADARALVVDLRIAHDKDPQPYAAALLALVDQIGVARAVLYGRDAGALVACAFRIAQPRRVAALVIENQRERCDEALYKKRMKKDPNYAFGGYESGPWMLIAGADMVQGAVVLNVKKLGGRIVMLWPQHKGGRRPAKGYVDPFCKKIAANVKAIQLVDSYTFTDADIAEERSRRAAPAGGAAKGGAG